MTERSINRGNIKRKMARSGTAMSRKSLHSQNDCCPARPASRSCVSPLQATRRRHRLAPNARDHDSPNGQLGLDRMAKREPRTRTPLGGRLYCINVHRRDTSCNLLCKSCSISTNIYIIAYCASYCNSYAFSFFSSVSVWRCWNWSSCA